MTRAPIRDAFALVGVLTCAAFAALALLNGGPKLYHAAFPKSDAITIHVLGKHTRAPRVLRYRHPRQAQRTCLRDSYGLERCQTVVSPAGTDLFVYDRAYVLEGRDGKATASYYVTPALYRRARVGATISFQRSQLSDFGMLPHVEHLTGR